MSYIIARKVDQEEAVGAERGFSVPEIDFEERDKNTLDAELDFEILDFLVALINQVNDLDEGEALVIWKEIF